MATKANDHILYELGTALFEPAFERQNTEGDDLEWDFADLTPNDFYRILRVTADISLLFHTHTM